MFDIALIGDKELQKKLNKMEKKVAAKALKGGMREAMLPVKELAKQRAPRDKGLLRRSIRVAASSNRKGVSAMVRTGTRRQLKIPANAAFYYPAAHEYGTRYMPARSFLRSSLAAKKNQVINSLSQHIRSQLVSS